MKKCILILLPLMLISGVLKAQTTYSPSCFSNADGWTIEKIEQEGDGTYVYLNFYSYIEGYEFFINAGMFIENYNNTGSAKYYITRFLNYEIGTKYKLRTFTNYTFILKFEKIPSYWTDINIKEPYTEGYISWYWNYISLNKPSNERLKADNFIRGRGLSFLKSFVHPTNTFRFYKYSVDYNGIDVVLYYEKYTTDLRIKIENNLVTSVYIKYDNDWVNPFSLLGLIRSFIISEDNNGKASMVEKYLRKTINEMDGKELACVALTILLNL